MRSMYRIDGMVASSITIPTTPVASRDVVFELKPRAPKICPRISIAHGVCWFTYLWRVVQDSIDVLIIGSRYWKKDMKHVKSVRFD